MKKQIINIAPVQTAKVFAVLYFVMSLPFVVLMAISFAASPAQAGPPIVFLLAMPFVYLILGFIFTAIGAWIYNKIASWVGGIEYTSIELP